MNENQTPNAAAVTARTNHRCSQCDHGVQCDPFKSWACPKCGAELIYIGTRLETRHTPGPWRFHHRTAECFAAIHAVTGQGGQGSYLASIGGGNPEIDEANGRLMAAAPELLAALKDLVEEIRAYSSPECDDEGAIGAEELKAADTAIAKAEGKELQVAR